MVALKLHLLSLSPVALRPKQERRGGIETGKAILQPALDSGKQERRGGIETAAM